LRHLGSESFFRVLQRDGANTDIAAHVSEMQAKARVYREQTKRYWLYQ
jgi:hypothetical protein